MSSRYHSHLALLFVLFLLNFLLAWFVVKLVLLIRNVLKSREMKRLEDSLDDFVINDEIDNNHFDKNIYPVTT
jgi:hypothetical protein